MKQFNEEEVELPRIVLQHCDWCANAGSSSSAGNCKCHDIKPRSR